MKISIMVILIQFSIFFPNHPLSTSDYFLLIEAVMQVFTPNLHKERVQWLVAGQILGMLSDIWSVNKICTFFLHLIAL